MTRQMTGEQWRKKTFNFSMPVRPSISAGLVVLPHRAVFLCYIFVNITFPEDYSYGAETLKSHDSMNY